MQVLFRGADARDIGRVGIRWEVVVVGSEFGTTLNGVAVPVAGAILTAPEDATGQVLR
jgi:hypothetical protein